MDSFYYLYTHSIDQYVQQHGYGLKKEKEKKKYEYGRVFKKKVKIGNYLCTNVESLKRTLLTLLGPDKSGPIEGSPTTRFMLQCSIIESDDHSIHIRVSWKVKLNEAIQFPIIFLSEKRYNYIKFNV